jgi:uncharacterized protein YgiM (DUF1202 family)
MKFLNYLLMLATVCCCLQAASAAAAPVQDKAALLHELVQIKKTEKRLTIFDYKQKQLVAAKKQRLMKNLSLPLQKDRTPNRLANFVALVPVWIWQVMLLLLLCFLAAALCCCYFIVVSRSFFIALLLTVSVTIQLRMLQTSFADEAFVSVVSTNLYSGPLDSYPVVKTVTFGQELKIAEERGGFAKVETIDSQGWIDIMAIEKV